MADPIRAALVQLAIRRQDYGPALQHLQGLEERLQQLERLHQLVQASGPLTCEQVLRIWREDL